LLDEIGPTTENPGAGKGKDSVYDGMGVTVSTLAGNGCVFDSFNFFARLSVVQSILISYDFC
jgi:hypothetical protein